MTEHEALTGAFPDGLAPLDGVRVVDMTRLIPGALAARRLADLGADVIKIEEPGRGDYARTIPPLVNSVGLIHRVLNRNKRSVALDLKVEEERAQIVRLLEAADVLIEVSRPGRLARAGIDLERIRSINPKLIVCHITGYGQMGPLEHLPSHGMNTDAYGGTLIVESRDGRPAIASRSALGIELGGINAASAVMAALVRAARTGRGAELDVSCWDACVDLQRSNLTYFLATGEHRVLTGELGPLYDIYECADGGLVVFCAIEQKFWRRFCDGIGRPDLSETWSSTGEVDYGSAGASLRTELEGIFLTAPAARWVQRFEAWDVPGCPILAEESLTAHPHFIARSMSSQAEGAAVPDIGDPVVWMDEHCRPGLLAIAAPELGADTREVLREWLPG